MVNLLLGQTESNQRIPRFTRNSRFAPHICMSTTEGLVTLDVKLASILNCYFTRLVSFSPSRGSMVGSSVNWLIMQRPYPLSVQSSILQHLALKGNQPNLPLENRSFSNFWLHLLEFMFQYLWFCKIMDFDLKSFPNLSCLKILRCGPSNEGSISLYHIPS